MGCDNHEEFTNEVMQAIEALYRKHGFDQLTIHHGNPLTVSMRGHVPDPEKPEEAKTVVMVVELSIGLDERYQNFGNLETVTQVRQRHHDNGNHQHDPLSVEA